MAKLTTPLYNQAAKKLNVIKDTAKTGEFSVELTPREQVIYEQIPDDLKKEGLAIIGRMKPYSKDFDMRETLFKKGLVNEWKNIDNMEKAYMLGYKAREEILDVLDG